VATALAYDFFRFLRRPLIGDTGEKVGILRLDVGDRVVQTRNDYTLGIVNGELGIVQSVGDGEAVIAFDTKTVKMSGTEAINLQYAYAMTVHKSQGSEFPAVVMPLSTAHWIMLERSWFYTALTRAKSRAIIVADTRAFKRAIKNVASRKRETCLEILLRKKLG
ncbi:ATP-dependent RecD-like DNA helicase, partial [Halorhodospira halochloris]|uniref:ATP-dependent DNA helicase n=1 Tax=Halorhodospira halochloris TaxID=1052 RepID=UPI001EE88BE3